MHKKHMQVWNNMTVSKFKICMICSFNYPSVAAMSLALNLLEVEYAVNEPGNGRFFGKLKHIFFSKSVLTDCLGMNYTDGLGLCWHWVDCWSVWAVRRSVVWAVVCRLPPGQRLMLLVFSPEEINEETSNCLNQRARAPLRCTHTRHTSAIWHLPCLLPAF